MCCYTNINNAVLTLHGDNWPDTCHNTLICCYPEVVSRLLRSVKFDVIFHPLIQYVVLSLPGAVLTHHLNTSYHLQLNIKFFVCH